jgi:hypothetical protein
MLYVKHACKKQQAVYKHNHLFCAKANRKR